MLKKLAHTFREQEAFATGYSPLYARAFGIVAGWLEEEDAHNKPMVKWLLQHAQEAKALEVTLLLMAGLHKGVLAQRLPQLAVYFPTARGSLPTDDNLFEQALQSAIWQERERLSPFMKTATVQTNESGRGLCWLLPLRLTNWKAVHLVDLGASAGLNLLADHRHYHLADEQTGQRVLDLGQGAPPQFHAICRQVPAELEQRLGALPLILTRQGGDLHPFPLRSEDDALTLMSFVWGDHVVRMERMRQGIEAFHQVGGVQLAPLTLPDGLTQFLHDHVPESPHPVLIYNTVMSMYLRDRGASLRHRIATWARLQQRPVLWVQWEPPQQGESPHHSWMSWTAELWQQGVWQQQQLGWVHPHGLHIHFTQLIAPGGVFDTIQGQPPGKR